jgi:hypothetical protein
MNSSERSNDASAIMDVIAAESVAFWDKDFEAWSRCWVHEPYVRVLGWWARGGVTVMKGWEAISERMKEVMTENPQPNPTAARVRRENINLRIDGNTAWVTFDQFGEDTGDVQMDMPGLSHETRFLEKQDGEWRIVYVNWLLEG